MEPWDSTLHAPQLLSPRDWGVPPKTYIAFLRREGHTFCPDAHTHRIQGSRSTSLSRTLPSQNHLSAERKPRAVHALGSPPRTSISGSPQTLQMSLTQCWQAEIPVWQKSRPTFKGCKLNPNHRDREREEGEQVGRGHAKDGGLQPRAPAMPRSKGPGARRGLKASLRRRS